MNTHQKDKMKSSDYLSEEEQQESKQQLFFYNICLIAGSVLILFSLIYLLQHLGNNSVYWIGFLGLFCAIPFFIIYGIGMKSIKNKTNSNPKNQKHKA
ncbi:hypothetical protein JW824_04185 [bacterium]|nr:hypothetical protein [bacterium]